MEFSQILKNLMNERGYTNYRLSKILGCSQTTVANWLNGTIPQNDMTFSQIANAFEVSVEYLKGETVNRGEPTKKAPVRQDERGMWDDRKHKMLITLFERLSPEDQNDVIFELLQKAQSQLDQDSQK